MLFAATAVLGSAAAISAAAPASHAATGPANIPPIGARLDTVADDLGTIKLDGAAVADTTRPCAPESPECFFRASYALFDRTDLHLIRSGNVATSEEGMKLLLDLATSHETSGKYLMVVGLNRVTGQGIDDGQKLWTALGGAKLTGGELQNSLSGGVISIVGVPGSPARSAFISNHFPGGAPHQANMSGYLRRNDATGDFEFVFADQVEFNTDASSEASQITMKVGDKTYAHSTSTDGRSGFFLVLLDSQTLALHRDFTFFTNRADGSQDEGETQRMANELAIASADSPLGYPNGGRLLVMLQAFGKPHGTRVNFGWLSSAAAIERLGGNAQVFAQMNQGGTDSPHYGRYAFVGRSASDTPAAESSYSLTGHGGDGKLHGLIARGRDDQYEPFVADPGGAVNFALVRIVNRPSPPGGGFKQFTSGEQAAENFLGSDPNVIGVCPHTALTCDVRKAYYENYVGTNWANILTRLGLDATKAKCASGGSDAAGTAFTAADCDMVRQQLELEIGQRNAVEEYFGPKGLQAPFGGAETAAIVDLPKISEEIRATILKDQPEPDNAISNTLSLISNIAKLGSFSGLVCKACGSVAGGLTGGFAIAAYLTKKSGAPNLVGPEITAKAADLGPELLKRYQSASDYFTTEAKIIMSDASKMSEVAALVDNDPEWKLGDTPKTRETLRLATKQAIYTALIPTAYPILYDLGTGRNGQSFHATAWQCVGAPIVPYVREFDKHLFQNTSIAAEVPYDMTDGRYLGQNHLFVVGARNAVGSKHDAYIPSPRENLTGPMFEDPESEGGIGLYKLELYSPANFRVFSPVLQQSWVKEPGEFGYDNCSKMPDPPGNSG